MLEKTRPDDAPVLGAAILRHFKITPHNLTHFERLIFSVAIILVAGTAFLTFTDVLRYAGLDFRNRVVGARLLLRGENPYTFTWQPEMPEELLDPTFDPVTPLHRLTVPPTTLCLYLPVAWLPYRALRLLSWALEWGALLVSVSLLGRMLPRPRLRFFFLLIVAFFFIFSDFWRMHLERGQVYVFHLLMLGVGMWLIHRHGMDSWRAGIAFGLAAALRPNFLLLAPAFLVLGRWRTGAGIVASSVAAVLLTFPLAPPAYWRSYVDVGDAYYLYSWNPEAVTPYQPPPAPAIVEGYDFNSKLFGTHSTSLCAAYRRYSSVLLDMGRISKGLLLVEGLVLLGLLYWRRQRGPRRLALGLIAVFLVIGEYLLPHRWVYTDVMFLLPLCLLLPALRRSLPFTLVPAGAVMLGLILGQGLWVSVDLLPLPTTLIWAEPTYLLTIARSVLVMGGLTDIALVAWAGQLRPPSAPVAPAGRVPADKEKALAGEI
jgi:hypothetical protein